MLHALDHRKARLSFFRAAGARVPLEDVVTSTVFGPLEFMSQADRGAILSVLLRAVGISTDFDPQSVQFCFWPKRTCVDQTLRSSYVEPDALIEDRDGAVLLIEVKWGAPLGQFELAAQWQSLTPSEQCRAEHLLLVREPRYYETSISTDKTIVQAVSKAPWMLHSVSWRAFARALDAIVAATQAPHIRAWGERAARVLRREDSSSIEGWSSLPLVDVEVSNWRFSAPFFKKLARVVSKQAWWRE